MSDKYRLLKDSPDGRKAGTIYYFHAGAHWDCYRPEKDFDMYSDTSFLKKQVENNPEWFEKVEEEKPCRCAVSHKWLNDLEKKARAGEELATRIHTKSFYLYTHGELQSAIQQEVGKYREAVKE